MMDVWREIAPLEVVLRLGLAILVGGLVGGERERKKRPAGIKTHMIVCLGAALVMITNQYIMEQVGMGDPVRMGAQVISGIGFLGAGTIMVTGRNQIKGLTTAATLWLSGCLGLAIGVGFYSGALIAYGYIFVTLMILKKVDRFISTNSKVFMAYVEFEHISAISPFLEYLKLHGLAVSDMDMMKATIPEEKSIIVFMTIQSAIKRSHVEWIHLLSQAEGILHIEEL